MKEIYSGKFKLTNYLMRSLCSAFLYYAWLVVWRQHDGINTVLSFSVRGGMVENNSQYVFIHRAMFHYWRSLRSVSSSEGEDEARDVVLDALYE